MWLGWKSGVALSRPFFKKKMWEGVKYKHTTMAQGNYQND